MPQEIEIRPTPPTPCGSCRALARLRKRCARRRRYQQYRRLRSLAGARQLPHLSCVAPTTAMPQAIEISATPPIPCGSCRALARLQKRCLRRRKCQQYRRLRSLAKARQLPHLSFIAPATAITQWIEIRPTPPTPCGSCRALARLRKRCLRRRKCQQYRRLRSLARARQLPHLGCVAPTTAMPQGIEISATPQIPCGSCRAPAGCESGVSGAENASNTAAFAASPGLDNSHTWAASRQLLRCHRELK
jgi:hypothetical protein